MLMAARLWPGNGVGLVVARWAAILYTATVGNLYIALSPMFWGGYHDYLNLTDEGIGALMSAEFSGSTAATIASFFYMHHRGLDLRRIVFAALGVGVFGNLATPFLFETPTALMAVRVLCGICAGTSYVAAAAAITGIGSPQRLVAIFYGAPFIVGAALQPTMNPLFQHWGFSTAFVVMAVAAAASAALYAYFPRYADGGETLVGRSAPGLLSHGPVIVLSLGLLLQYTGNSGIWLCFERIGQLSGHSAQVVANVVGVGTGMSLVGTWLSTVLVKKVKAVDGILWGTGAITLSSITLHFAGNMAAFAGAVSVFNAMITFLTPFYFVLLARTHAPTRAVVIGNICMALGFSAGPLLIRYTVHDADFSRSIDATILLFVVSAGLAALFQILNKKLRGRTIGDTSQ